MAKLNFLNKEAPLKEDVAAYDAGQSAGQVAQTTAAPPPQVNVGSMPQQQSPSSPQEPEIVGPGDDDKYGFVEKDMFDKVDTEEGYEPQTGYQEMEAFAAAQDSRNNNFDLLGITEHHDETTRIAARDSDLGGQDYSHMGMAWRSITAGIGSQIFTAAGDTIDWIDSVNEWASAKGESDVKSLSEGMDVWKDGTPASRGEQFQPGWNPGSLPLSAIEYLTGVDLTKSFTDGLRAIGAALETVDDGVEQQFRNEHGGQFITLDENGKPKVDYGQLLIADFWFSKVAKQIPNIVTFYYAGAGMANMSVKGYQALQASKVVASGSKSFMSPGAIKTATKLFGQKAGESLAKVTTEGVVRGLGAGMGSNLAEGAVLAGEAHRQALEEGLTKDQAAIVGLQVVRDNLKYMAIDAIQWGVLDKGWGAIGKSMSMRKGINFKHAARDILIHSGLTASSGKAEEFQEVYQDWRVKTNLAHMKGEEFMSYWDYFNSPEVAETRLVSFGMGALMGGFGSIKTMVNDAAVASGYIDDKIEASGYGDGGDGGTPGSGLLFAEAEARLKKNGTKGGEFTQDEIIVHDRHKQIENAVIGAVAMGDANIAEQTIKDKVEKGEYTKEEGAAALELLKEVDQAFVPFRSGKTGKMPMQFRKEAARIAYAIAREQKDISEINEIYDKQKAEVEGRTVTNKQQQKQKDFDLASIEQERQSAINAKQATIAEYTAGLDQTYNDALNYLKERDAEINKKNKGKRDSVKKRRATDERTKMDEAQKEGADKASKVAPKDRKKRINEATKKAEENDARIKKLENEITQMEEGMGDVDTKENVDRLNQLKAERDALIKERDSLLAETNALVKEQKLEGNREKARKRTIARNKKKLREGKLRRIKDTRTKKEKAYDESRVDQLDAYQTKVNEKVVADRYFGMEQIYRDRLAKKGINLVVFDYFSQTKEGQRYVGLAQGLSIYLNANSATQLDLFHELAHVYLMEFWDSVPVKALRRLVLNQPIFQKAKELYMNSVLFMNKETGESNMYFADLVYENELPIYDVWKELKENKEKTKADYYNETIKKLEKKGFSPLPDAEQRIINEEAVVALISLMKDNRSLNGLIDLSTQSKVKGAMKGLWKKAKKKLTKEEQSEVLEKTGNESLANAKDILSEVIKDFNNQVLKGEGKLNFRRDRDGLGEKMRMGSLKETHGPQITPLVEKFYQEQFELRGLTFERDADGRMSAESLLQLEQIADEIKKDLKQYMNDIRNENNKLFNDQAWKWWSDPRTQRAYRNDFIKSHAIEYNDVMKDEGERIDDSAWLENYLDNRNGDTSTRGQWAKQFIRMEQNIQMAPPSEKSLTKALWNAVHDKGLGLISEETFYDNMKELQRRFRAGESLTLGEEHLVRYINFLEQLYKNKQNKENQWDPNDVIRQLHHDVKGFKRIEFMIYYQAGGKTQLQKPKGIEMVRGEKIANLEKRVQNTLAQNFINENSYNKETNPNGHRNALKKIENIMSLVGALQTEKTLTGKKRLVAEYIYNNHLPAEYKDSVTVNDLMETSQVEAIAKDGGKQLFIDLAAFRIYKGGPENALEDFNQFAKQQDLAKKGYNVPLLRKAVLTSIKLFKNGDLKLIGKWNTVGPFNFKGFGVGNNKRIAFQDNLSGMLQTKGRETFTPTSTFKLISGAVVESLRAENFETMYQMPGGERTAIMSKKHQMDILMDMMPMFKEMNKTPEGQTRLQTLFGDNPLIKRMLENGIEPKLIQILGAEMFRGQGREGYNAGDLTANDISDLQIDLIADAISGKQSTYSQGISLFGDKSIDIHLNNAPLYSLSDARAEADKIFSKEEQNKFIEDLKEYMSDADKLYTDTVLITSPEMVEQIALNYAINKYHAKDLFIGPQGYFKIDRNTGTRTRDYIKRAAGAVAMHVGLGSENRIEPIMIKDIMMHVNPETGQAKDTTDMSSEEIKKLEDKGFVEVNRADACSFILPEDSQHIEKTYGQVRPVGKHYKFVYYGQNLDNTTLESQVGARHPFYGKTNVFVLTPEFIASNPNFKHLAESLRLRKESSNNQQVQTEKTKRTIPMIMTASSIKVTGKLGGHYLSVNELAGLNENEGAGLNAHQDGLFKFNDSEGTPQYGLDGSFFGVQTELDKRGDTASVSKQLIFMMHSNPNIPMEEIHELMNSLVEAFSSQTNGVFKRFGTGERTMTKKELQKILNNILESADPDTYSKSTIQLIKEGSLDNGSLEVIQSIIRSNVIKKGIKMRGPGGLGVQSTDFAVGTEVPGSSVSKSEGLKGYERDSEGNVITPAEVVIDESTARSLGLVEGDTIIVQRIPTSKMGDGVVCKVKSITQGQGTMVMISSEVSGILGSDLDGDALHIVGKNKKAKKGSKEEKWNTAFDKMTEMLMDGRNREYTESGINELDGVVKRIKKNLGITAPTLNDLSIKDNRDIYLSNREGQKNIGISATYNNGHKILSAYNVQGAELNVSMDGGLIGRSYKDQGQSWLNLAYMLNIFLDDANKGFAADLNLNEHTFSTYAELISRGVDLETAVKIMTHPSVVDMVNKVRNNRGIKSISEVAKIEYTIPKNPSQVVDLNTKKLDPDSIATLITRVNNFQTKSELDALRHITSLDTNMPETSAEGINLIDSLMVLASGGVKTRTGEIVPSSLDVSGLLTSDRDIQQLRRALFEGNFDFIRNNIRFESPILKKNFDTLVRFLENQRKLDPAFNMHQVINRIFPIGTSTTGVLNQGMTKQEKKNAINKIMARLRVESLAQDGVYDGIIDMFSSEMNEIVNGLDGNLEQESSMKYFDELTKENVPQTYLIHSLIENIILPHISSGNEYQFLSSFLIVREKIKNKEGYVEVSKTGETTEINENGEFAALERKYGKEYEILPNMENLKNMDPKVIKQQFEKLPPKIQKLLYLYDVITNNHDGPSALFPYLHGSIKQKIIESSQNQVVNREEGSLSSIDSQKMADGILNNNKNSVKDVTSILYNNKGQLKIERNAKKYDDNSWRVIAGNRGSIFVGTNAASRGGIIHGDVVRITLPGKDSKADNKVSVLYRVADELAGGMFRLSPIRDFRDKSVPSNKKLERHQSEPGSTKMYSLSDGKILGESTDTSIGKTKDGQNIVDHDGKYGSTQMYQLVEEEQAFNQGQTLEFADFMRAKYQVSDINNLKEGDIAKYNKEGELVGGYLFEYEKYLNDVNVVDMLTEKYLKKDALGSTELEKSQYSVKRILLILRVDVAPLDSVAKAKLYKEMGKILAAKLALQSVDHILKTNKGLTDAQKADLTQLRLDILQGRKSFKDVTQGEMWMSPDITTTERLEIGEMLKEIDKSEMHYRRELAKIKKKTDGAYNNLLKEKLKGKLIPWKILKFIYESFPPLRHMKAMSKYIFGNLVEEVEAVDPDTGRYYRVLQLRDLSPAQLKELSKAEREYYEMYQETTKMFEDHLSQRKGTDGQPVLQNTRGKLYIPNRSAGKFEMMINRNFTAAFIAHNYDSALKNINVKDEKGNIAPLGEFIEQAKQEQAYQGKSINDWSRKQKLKRLIRQAERHLKSGKDAAGLPAVRAENVENLTQGEAFNRYTSARSSNSAFSASYQIHNNLNQYIEKNLFYHGLNSKAGNKNGFTFSGTQDLLPLIDGIINYQEWKGNPNAMRWVQELYKDRWLLQQGKKSLIGKEGKIHWADKMANHLMSWTMFVGLAVKPKVALLNILIGKYNEIGRSGAGSWVKSEKRFWGDVYKHRSFNKSKTWGITDYFGLISAPTQQVTEGMWGGPFGQLMFGFMTSSEAYIQRTAFISQLTEAQWNSFEMVDGELVVKNQEVFETIRENAQEMKDNVYSVQGRGYTATDQRLIQNYFIVNGLLQFKRWFPTFVMDRVGKEKIDRFGKQKIGSLSATVDFVKDIIYDGELGDIRGLIGQGEKFDALPEHRKLAIQKFYRRGFMALMLLAIISFAGGFDDDEDESETVKGLKGLFMDLMLLVNVKKLWHMGSAPMLQTGENITVGLYNLLTGAKYQRDTDRFDEGDLKFKGDFLKTMPLFLRDVMAGKKD